jgi:hypothetical protein
MSSSCRCAGAIIARPISVAMKPHGGKKLVLTRQTAARALWLETHPSPIPDKMGKPIISVGPQ